MIKKILKSFWNIVLYFFGILFILAGLTSIYETNGIIVIALGVSLLPIVYKKLNINSVAVRIIIPIVLLFLFGNIPNAVYIKNDYSNYNSTDIVESKSLIKEKNNNIKDDEIDNEKRIAAYNSDYNTEEKESLNEINSNTENVIVNEEEKDSNNAEVENITDSIVIDETDNDSTEVVIVTENEEEPEVISTDNDINNDDKEIIDNNNEEVSIQNNNESIVDSNEDETPVNIDDSMHLYILNTNTKKFHKAGCYQAKKIKESNRWEYTGSRDDVLNMGYEPCKTCGP